ncbi:leucyl/phenylalanyl-tRNA--protein transferase [Pelagibacterium limicola]|uniref:leucyl/phenylalanyl-tRNA--protein transferase n=1 Tax=Pelagibacterium limicola TaxID=2791022 RepID=UPI0018AFF49F|nr:leucyl/phenylalanyl-tRNA--protein transferase [Pelagibacterium limicola]
MPQNAGKLPLSRLALATAYWLKPPRVKWLPFLAARIVREMLSPPPAIPDVGRIDDRPPGFGGLATDLTTPTVLAAFRRGFYPMAHWGRMKWWSPPQRATMPLENVHIAKRFRRTMRQTDLRVAFDSDFNGVISGCAAPRDRARTHLTWITPQAKALYMRLFDEGHAHSVEIYDTEDQLVGGLFGLAAGHVFSALSMFHTADNASKFAIVSLYHHLEEAGFTAVDHQIMSGWVEDLGGIDMPRHDYIAFLERPVTPAWGAGRWNAQFTLQQTADWKPRGEAPGKKSEASAA